MMNVLAKLSSTVLLVMLAVTVSACPHASAPPSPSATTTPSPLARAAPKTKTDLAQENLKGRVKKVVDETEYFSYSSGKKELVRRKRSETIYNVNGNRTESTHYDIHGKLSLRARFRYNEQGRLMAQRAWSLKTGAWTTRFEYDANGRKIRDVSDEPGKKGFLATVYEYEAGGRVVNETSYIDNKVSDTKRLTYDSAGNLIEETWSNADTNPGVRQVYKYGKDGHLVEWLLTSYGKNGAIQSKEIRTYSDDGNEATLADFENGQLHNWKSQYKFDSHGNWTKKTSLKLVTRDGKKSWEPDSWVFRTITYYPE